MATIQRLLADGLLPLRPRQAKGEDEASAPDEPDQEEQADVKEIIAEVQERVKREPSLRTRQPVKNILMQLTRYSRELQDFRDLTERIPREKAPAVAVNFRKTTEEIYASIRRNYEQFVEEEQDAVPKEPHNILLRIDVKSLSRLYGEQAREASGVRSTVLYTRDEQYGTRELLIGLADQHGRFNRMVEAERARYTVLGGTPAVAREIAKAFGAEIGKRIQREIEYY